MNHRGEKVKFDRDIDGSTAMLSTSIQQSEWDSWIVNIIVRLFHLIFGVFVVMIKEEDQYQSHSQLWFIFSSVVDLFQVLSFPLSPRFNNWGNSKIANALFNFFDNFGSNHRVSGFSDSLFEITLRITYIIVFLSILDAIYVGYSYSKMRLGMMIWPLKFLRFIVSLFVTVFYIPTITLFVYQFVRGVVIIDTVLTILALLLFIPFASFTRLLYIKTSPRPISARYKNYSSMVNGRVEFLHLLYKTGLVFIFTLAPNYSDISNTGKYLISYTLIIAMMILYARLVYLPFYWRITNKVFTGKSGIIVWTSICMFFTLFLDPNSYNESIGYVLVIGMPISFYLAYFLCDKMCNFYYSDPSKYHKRLRNPLIYIKKKLCGKVTKISINSKQNRRLFVDYEVLFDTNKFTPKWFYKLFLPNEWFCDLNTRFLQENDSLENISLADEIYRRGFDEFGHSSIMYTLYGRFCLSYHNDERMAYQLFSSGQNIRTNFDIEFFFFYHLDSRERKARGQFGEETDVISQMQLNKSLSIATQNHVKSLIALSKFWNFLISNNLSLYIIDQKITQFLNYYTLTSNEFAKLLEKHPNSARILRSYGFFIMEVKGDHQEAKSFFQRADNIDKEQAKKNSTKFIKNKYAQETKKDKSKKINKIDTQSNLLLLPQNSFSLPSISPRIITPHPISENYSQAMMKRRSSLFESPFISKSHSLSNLPFHQNKKRVLRKSESIPSHITRRFSYSESMKDSSPDKRSPETIEFRQLKDQSSFESKSTPKSIKQLKYQSSSKFICESISEINSKDNWEMKDFHREKTPKPLDKYLTKPEQQNIEPFNRSLEVKFQEEKLEQIVNLRRITEKLIKKSEKSRGVRSFKRIIWVFFIVILITAFMNFFISTYLLNNFTENVHFYQNIANLPSIVISVCSNAREIDLSLKSRLHPELPNYPINERLDALSNYAQNLEIILQDVYNGGDDIDINHMFNLKQNLSVLEEGVITKQEYNLHSVGSLFYFHTYQLSHFDTNNISSYHNNPHFYFIMINGPEIFIKAFEQLQEFVEDNIYFQIFSNYFITSFVFTCNIILLITLAWFTFRPAIESIHYEHYSILKIFLSIPKKIVSKLHQQYKSYIEEHGEISENINDNKNSDSKLDSSTKNIFAGGNYKFLKIHLRYIFSLLLMSVFFIIIFILSYYDSKFYEDSFRNVIDSRNRVLSIKSSYFYETEMIANEIPELIFIHPDNIPLYNETGIKIKGREKLYEKASNLDIIHQKIVSNAAIVVGKQRDILFEFICDKIECDYTREDSRRTFHSTILMLIYRLKSLAKLDNGFSDHNYMQNQRIKDYILKAAHYSSQIYFNSLTDYIQISLTRQIVLVCVGSFILLFQVFVLLIPLSIKLEYESRNSNKMLFVVPPDVLKDMPKLISFLNGLFSQEKQEHKVRDDRKYFGLLDIFVKDTSEQELKLSDKIAKTLKIHIFGYFHDKEYILIVIMCSITILVWTLIISSSTIFDRTMNYNLFLSFNSFYSGFGPFNIFALRSLISNEFDMNRGQLMQFNFLTDGLAYLSSSIYIFLIGSLIDFKTIIISSIFTVIGSLFSSYISQISLYWSSILLISSQASICISMIILWTFVGKKSLNDYIDYDMKKKIEVSIFAFFGGFISYNTGNGAATIIYMLITISYRLKERVSAPTVIMIGFVSNFANSIICFTIHPNMSVLPFEIFSNSIIFIIIPSILATYIFRRIKKILRILMYLAIFSQFFYILIKRSNDQVSITFMIITLFFVLCFCYLLYTGGQTIKNKNKIETSDKIDNK